MKLGQKEIERGATQRASANEEQRTRFLKLLDNFMVSAAKL